MNEDTASARIAVIWSPEARADLREIAREIAMQILYCIDRYLLSRTGDIKKLAATHRVRSSAVGITGCSSI
jgi:hypothetical protein